MVAIVTGNGLGLERSSAFVLGSRGQLGSAGIGRSGESVYVNAANGNLVITRQDEFFAGLGPDVGLSRTYNSQAASDGDNGDDWQESVYRKVVGTNGNATVTRVDWDGSETVYAQISSGLYRTTDGSGAHDQLAWSGSQWTWTDGDSRVTDTYDSNGRLLSSADTDGNTLTYAYVGGTDLISRVTSTNSGGTAEYTDLNYSGTQLTHLTTVAGSVTMRVFYQYDQNRLSKVVVNIDPADQTPAGAAYSTDYGYDGSGRVTSIVQTDGSRLDVTYDGSGRVSSYTQTVATGVTRTTGIDYAASGRTVVTDPAGQKTTLFYDASNNLTQISYPPTDPYTNPRVVQFTYDSSGNVTRAISGPGNVVTYSYDSNGNRTLERDSAGNTVARTYGSRNELLTETRYLVPDPDGAGSGQPSGSITSRFAYDSENHLRYTVSAEGNVTRYDYNAAGLQVAAVEYTDNAYSLAGLADNASISESALDAWSDGLADKSLARRTQTTYDHRGNVSSVISYSKLLSSGAFDTGSALTQTNYVYDRAGNLLSRVAVGSPAIETFVYDGLNRLTLASDLAGALTRTTYLDALGQTIVTHANGLSEISTYDKAGELISFSRSIAGGNLVDLTGWPGNPASVPSGYANVPGWLNITPYTDETRWVSMTGPNGSPVVAMQAGQIDSSAEGGGDLTNWVTVDTAKAYEFTYYFQLSAPGQHHVYFGLGGGVVEYLSNGAAEDNPYFHVALMGSQASTFTTGKWYKVVGYVLPQGTPLSSAPLGGIYDAETGQKVTDIFSNFRWRSTAPTMTTFSRFFDYYGEGNPGYSTYFYQPEVRQVTIPQNNNLLDTTGWPGDPANVPTGQAIVTGWQNPSSYTDETQWAATTGPSGSTVVAMQAGQLDTGQEGGGSITGNVTIDASKAYEFTYYFKLSGTLDRHNVYFGLSANWGSGGAYVEYLADGTESPNPYFFVAAMGQQAGTLVADKWYKVVGYVLPQGAAAPSSPLGGVYDVSTGQKVADVWSNFRWNPERPSNEIYSRFFDFYGETNSGYSTYFYKPEIREASLASLIAPDAETSRYLYDNLGRLRMTTDPTGRRAYMFYDSVGRKVADIDADGSAIEYRYDGNDNLTSTTRYATRLTSTQLASLVDSAGRPTSATFASLRPAASASEDQWTFQVYDAAQRLIQTIDGMGATAVFTYDGASRTTKTTQYANRLSSATLDALKGAALNPNIWTYPHDATQWPYGNLTRTATGTTIEGAPAFQMSVVTGGEWEGFANGAFTAYAGDTFSYTISILAVGAVTTDWLGLYSYTPSSWGDTTEGWAAIVSGPGTLTQQAGSLYAIAGLSTTEATRVTITRRMTYDDAVAAYMYIKTTDFGAVAAGDATIVAAPVMVRTHAAAIHLPTAAATNDRVSRTFHDADGRVIATMDAAGGLSQIVYDKGGRKIRELGSAKAVIQTLRAAGTLDALKSDVGTSASDRRVDYVYDSRGFLRYTIDAAAKPVEYVHDARGNVIRTIDYAGSIGAASSYSLAYVQAQIAAGLGSNSANRISRNVYDLAGRLAFGIDAAGAVTALTYDSVGNVTKRVAYDTLYSAAGDPSLATMQSWAATNTLVWSDRVTRSIHDIQGRVLYTIDGAGAVVENRYDDAGRLIKQISYVDPYVVPEGATKDSLAALIGAPTTAVTVTYAYDADGRLSDVTDGVNAVTHYTYNAFGAVVDETVAYGTSDASTVHYSYYVDGRVHSETHGYGTAVAATTAYVYDSVGNVTVTYDPASHVWIRTYDAVGRVLTITAPVDSNSANDLITTNEYDAFGDLVRVSDRRGNSTFNYYDSLGRLTLQSDAEGYVTQTSYTAFGEVYQVTRRATRGTGAPTVTTGPTVVTGSGDATTTFSYDNMGRLKSVTDAENYVETYWYNSFGNRSQLQNKTGGISQYAYDRRGLVYYRWTDSAVHRADGSVQASGLHNELTIFDFAGRLAHKIEAFGLTERRDTYYNYDKAGRLSSVTHDPVQVTGTDLSTTTTVTPSEGYTYNLRGDLIQAEDTVHGKTMSWYDALGRKTDQLSAAGTFTHWSYDADGNIQSERVYATKVTVPSSRPAAPPTPATSAEDRQTSHTYDRSNRLVSTTVEGLSFGVMSGGSYVTTYSGETTTQIFRHTNYAITSWDVVQESDGLGSNSWTWYDKLGRKTAQVDREGYLTTWDLDANGNVLTERRFSNRITASIGATHVPSDLVALAGIQSADRATTFLYDRNGRRVQEKRWDVLIGNLDGVGSTTNAIVAYEYNGLGLVTKKWEANLDLTTYTYDNQGRLTRVMEAAVVDYTGTWYSPTTETFYDGLGHVVRNEVNREGGASANDRVTTYTYGAGGRLASTTDAGGFVRNFAYDVGGRLVKESWSRLKSDNATWVTEAIGYRYDAAGRVTTEARAAWNGSTWTFGDATRTRYNAFGEVNGRGITGGPDDAAVYQETMDYDSGGRLWKTTAGDGTTKILFYDKAGNATLTMSSAGAALSGFSASYAMSTLTSAGDTTISGAVTTIAVYDKRGQQIQTIEPDRNLTATGGSVTLTTSQTYNAFGEVLSETDALSRTTDYAYNTMGRLIEKKSPAVDWRDQYGAVGNARPTETYYYDISGRLIGSRDANGNLTSRALVAGTGHEGGEALFYTEYHADGGQLRNYYDQFRQVVIEKDELNRDKYYNYDMMGRVNAVAHRGGLLTDTYVYDGLGRRTRHYNSQFGSGVIERTDYDVQGRIESQIDYLNGTTSYSYSWDAALGTNGFGYFGGWTKITTTDGAPNSSTEHTDYFGRLVYKIDFGSNGSYNTFDLAGRLIARGDGLGQSQSISYFNTGLVHQIVDAAGSGKNAITATYGYDEAGNRTYEGYAGTVYSFHFQGVTTSSSLTLQNATIAYDALGRITSFTDKDAAGTTRITVAQEYDLVGNIRRTFATYPNLAYPAQGAVPRDLWYRYDPMNRMVVADGILLNGQIVRGATGADISYDVAGQRRTQTKDAALTGQSQTWIWYPEYDPQYGHLPQVPGDPTMGYYGPVDANYMGARREDYEYFADGSLKNVKFAETGYTDNGDGTVSDTGLFGGAVLRAEYTRDALTRITQYREFASDGISVTRDRNTISYDYRGNVTHEIVDQSKTQSGTYLYRTIIDNGYTGDGRLSWTTADEYKQGSDNDVPDTRTDYSYTWRDGAQVASTTFDSDTGSSSNPVWTSTYAYDGLGRLASVRIDDGRPRTVSFASTPEGQVLNRKERSAATNNPEDQRYFISGRQIGELTSNGNNDPDKADYAQTLNNIRNWTPNPTAAPFRWNTTGGVTSGTFGIGAGYQAINPEGNGAQSAGSSYTVRDGETLQSIAANLWGDSSLWYLIASANGMSAGQVLAAGQTLAIPDRVTNVRNSAGTFKPYDPNAALGDLSPTTAKPPKKAGKCGMMGQILMVVVAVAVTALTAGAGAALSGAAAGIFSGMGAMATGAGLTAGQMIAIGAVAGAAGSIASQGVGVATGVQNKISWKGVAMSALSSAISAGVGVSGVFANAGSKFAQGALNAGLSSALTQGIGVATGLQNKFSWAGVAGAAAAGGFAGAMNQGLKTGPLSDLSARNIGANLATSAVSAMANAGARSLIEGSNFGDNIMAALPDVIGGTIGNLIAGAAQRTGRRNASELQFAQADQPVLPGQAATASDSSSGIVPPPLNAANYPNLTPADVADLQAKGIGAERAAIIDATIGSQAAENTASPSLDLSGSRRNSILRLIAGGANDTYEQYKALSPRMRNAFIDSDTEVIAVRTQVRNGTVSTDGTTLTGIRLNDRQYEFAVHLGVWGKVHGSNATGAAITSDAQVAAAANQINSAPAKSTGDIAASQSLRRFAYNVAMLTDGAQIAGSQDYEKVVRIEGNDQNGYFVTAIRGGGTNGSRLRDLVNTDTAAVLHHHYAGLVQPPTGGDHSPIKFNDIPSFVYGGAENRLFEVFRVNQNYRYGRIDSSGNIHGSNPFPYVQ
jgi:YD repeat-containing protein